MRIKRSWIALAPTIGTASLVVAAIASPAAAAVNLMPDERAGALALIIPVTILMGAMVVEVWRQTGRRAVPAIDEEIAHRQARKRSARTR